MDASTQTSPDAQVERETLRRYAELIVGLGANVQPGQVAEVRATLEQRALVHEIVAAAYRRGARFVDVNWFDPYVRRSRIELADASTLDFVPSWHRERVRQLGEQRCARISLSPSNPPGLYEDLDPGAVAREPFPFLPDYMRLIDDNTTNWVGVACPTAAWAQQVHPQLEPDEALRKLWDEVLHACRLDEADPVAAWQERFDALARAEGALNEHRFDALHFEGPGTDFTLGLMPTSRWESGVSATVDGIVFAANLPTEETFTAPDPQRADGVVRATKPLQLKGGTLVDGLTVRFEAGRAVSVEADSGAEAMRSMLETHENADRLGEVALVDGNGRIGPLGTVFYNTLYDENAASHLALGSAYLDTVGEEDRDRVNRSPIHVDFMIGGDEVDVTGITRGSERVPVLRRGAWQI
ncbi:MAG TPA: aminopeptidase [Gaiellaceae bacterium]|nr:aminopeptidase [Gaiellaceae bacterium]